MITYKLEDGTVHTINYESSISTFKELEQIIQSDISSSLQNTRIFLENYWYDEELSIQTQKEVNIFASLNSLLFTVRLNGEANLKQQKNAEMEVDKLCNSLSLINSSLIQDTLRLSPRTIIRTEDEYKNSNILHNRLIAHWNMKLLLIAQRLTASSNPSLFLVQAVNKFLDSQTQPIEIFLFLGAPDIDLNSIIEKRIRDHELKKSVCLFLNKEITQILVDAPHSMIHGHKLSSLHEGNSNIFPRNEIEVVVNIAKKMPTLKKIVLRGCYTAHDYREKKIPVLTPKIPKILGIKRDIEQHPLEENEFLIQQFSNIETNVYSTKVKYRDIDNEMVIKNLPSIPWTDSKQKLTLEMEQALISISKDYNLPPLSLPLSNKKIPGINSMWEKNERISNEDKKLFQTCRAQTRTFESANLTARSPITSVYDNLYGRTVEVKGYSRNYYAFLGGSRNCSRGNNQAKAIKIRPSAEDMDGIALQK